MSIEQCTVLTQLQLQQLAELVHICNGYEPYYDSETHSENPHYHYILNYNSKQELTGFLSSLILNPNTVEVTALVRPDQRRQGIFLQMLHLEKMYWKEKSHQQPGLLKSHPQAIELIGSLPATLIESSCCREIYSYEYLMELKEVPQSLRIRNYSAQQERQQPSSCQPTLYESYFSDDYSAYLMYPEWEESDQLTDDEPVAVCSLDYEPSFTNLYEIYVDPELRGQGVGTQFLSDLILDYYNCEEGELPYGPVPLLLQVSSTNPAALKLYKKCGFHEKSHICYYKL